MALTVLLAEPDPTTARHHEGALREMEELELDVQVFAGADVLDEVERLRPDILVLRHERSGQPGFAVLSRLRKHPNAKNLPVLLTTTDATKDAVDRHRASPARADYYLMLPASRADLEEAVKMLAERARSNRALSLAAGGGPTEPPRLRPRASSSGLPWVQSAVSEVTMPQQQAPVMPEVTMPDDLPEGTVPTGEELLAGLDALDAPRPPPPGGEEEPTRHDVQLPRPGQPAAARGAGPSMDPTDVSFVERLFGTLGSLSESDPPGLPSRGGAAESMDARTAFLRDKLRERERDLQRLARLWRAKETEIHGTEARVQQKESEVESYIVQMGELTREVQRLQTMLADKEKELGSSMEGMLTERVMMEKDLIEVVAAKEKELFALKRERHEMESAAEGMKQQLVSRIYEWEAAYRDLDARLQRTVAHGAGILGDLYQRLDDTRVLLHETRTQLVRTESRVAVLQRARSDDSEANRELLANIHRTRETLYARIRDLSARARMQERAWKVAENEWREALLAAELETQRADAARQAWHARMKVVEGWLTTLLIARDEEIARLNSLYAREHALHVQAADLLKRQELAAEEMFHFLETDLTQARSEASALFHLRTEDRKAHEDRVHDLQMQLQRLADDVRARELRLDEAREFHVTLEEGTKRTQEAGEGAVREREARINELERRVMDSELKLNNANERRAGTEKTLASKEAALAELTAKLDTAAETHAALQTQLEQKEAEARTLQLRLDDRERAVNLREQQLQSLKNEVRQHKEELEKLHTEIEAQEETIRVKTLEARTLEASVQRKVTDIEELEQGRALMVQQVSRLEEAQGVLRGKNTELQTAGVRKDGEINRLQGEIARHVEEQNALKRQLDDGKAALSQVEETFQKADDDARAAAGRERALQAQVEAERTETAKVRAEVAGKESQIQALRQRVAQAERERGEEEAKVQLVQIEVATRDAHLARAQKDAEALKAQLAEKDADLEARASEMARLEARLTSVQAEVEAERKQLGQRVLERDTARDKLAVLGADLDAEVARSRELSSQLAGLKAMLAAAQEEQQALAGRQGESARTINQTHAEMQRLADALSQRDAALKGLETRAREREEHIRKQDTELESIQRALAESSTLVADLQRLQQDSEKNQGGISTAVEQLRGEKDALGQQLFQVQQQLRHAESVNTAQAERQRAMQQSEAAARDQMAASVAHAETTARDAEDRATRLRDELGAMRTQRDEQASAAQQLAARVRQLEDATREEVRERSTASGREQALSKQLAETRARVGQLENQHQVLSLQKTELEESITELKGQLDALNSARGVESELRQKSVEERARAAAHAKETEQALETFKKKLEERGHELERSSTRLEQEGQARAQLESSLAETRDRLGALEAEHAARTREKEELDRVRTQLAARTQQLERRVQEMTAQLTHADRSASDQLAEVQARLETQVQQAANEREELKKRIQDLDAAKARGEAAVRQATDEKESLRRQALKRLQEYDTKLKDAEARAAAAAEKASTVSSTSKEMELLKAETAKARTERDTMRKEALSLMQALQARVERLQRALTEAGLPIPKDTVVPQPARAPAPPPSPPPEPEGGATMVSGNPFLEDQARGGKS